MTTLHYTLRQMEVFSAIARLGTTSGAAEDIALSQSAVSSSLNDLESGLGVQLFDRIGKKLVLNGTGRALCGRAQGLLDQAMGIERDFQIARPSCHLKIAASTTIGNYLIPELLAAYARVAPHQQVEIHIGNTSDVVRSVAEFKVDVGVIEGPSKAPGLHLVPWRDDELVIVAASDHPLVRGQRATGAVIDRDTLRQATWLVREPGSGTRDAVQGTLLAHLGDVRQAMVLGSSEAIKRAVVLGLGISCLSKLLVDRQLQEGSLAELRTDLPKLARTFHLVVHQAREMNSTLREFFS